MKLNNPSRVSSALLKPPSIKLERKNRDIKSRFITQDPRSYMRINSVSKTDYIKIFNRYHLSLTLDQFGEYISILSEMFEIDVNKMLR